MCANGKRMVRHASWTGVCLPNATRSASSAAAASVTCSRFLRRPSSTSASTETPRYELENSGAKLASGSPTQRPAGYSPVGSPSADGAAISSRRRG